MSQKSRLIREVRLFEFYSRYIWPIHRRFVGKHLSKRCNTCFLSEKYIKLIEGKCELCVKGSIRKIDIDEEKCKEMSDDMDRKLKKAVATIKSGYHALVLFSGGKDSSYLLHRLQEDYTGIRILALTLDNTFMSPVAMENVSEIVKTIGVDHIFYRPATHTMQKMYRYAFTHLNEGGCSGTVDQFDGDFFSDVSRHVAAEKRIPYIICGLSRAQVTRILKLDSYITTEEYESVPRTEVAGINLKKVFNEQEMSYWWNPDLYPKEAIPRMMFPFFIWNLEEKAIKSEVLKLGLMPRGDESPLITNNQLIPLMGIVDAIQFGYSSFEPEFAENVRAGKADREQWLYSFEMVEYAAKTGRFLSASLNEVLAKLDLTRNELGIKG